jgi:translation initiation factor IF-1
MVRNVTGGNKSKGFARKSFVKKDSPLRVSEDESELYAQVTKLYGGRLCNVITLKGTEMNCHIRGKFAGRHKRDNLISNGTWLLVGLREWEKEPMNGKLLNCDIIEVYSDVDKNKLRNNITDINWNLFVTNDNKVFGNGGEVSDDGLTFEDEKTEEFNELIKSQIANSDSGKTCSLIIDNDEDINVDDI